MNRRAGHVQRCPPSCSSKFGGDLLGTDCILLGIRPGTVVQIKQLHGPNFLFAFDFDFDFDRGTIVKSKILIVVRQQQRGHPGIVERDGDPGPLLDVNADVFIHNGFD